MANHRECQFRRIGQIMPNPWDTLRYQPVHGARVDGYEALRGATMGEERGKPSFRRSLVDGRVRMPVGHRRCTRRKVTIGSGCRKLAGFASNGPCWYWVGYRAGRGGISGRSVAAQYDPTLRLYLTPPYVPLSASSASLSICTALVIRDRSNFERSCFVESCQRRSFRFSHR